MDDYGVFDLIGRANTAAEEAFGLLDAVESVWREVDSLFIPDLDEDLSEEEVEAINSATTAYESLAVEREALRRNAESFFKILQKLVQTMQEREARDIPECPMYTEGYPLCADLETRIAS